MHCFFRRLLAGCLSTACSLVPVLVLILVHVLPVAGLARASDEPPLPPVARKDVHDGPYLRHDPSSRDTLHAFWVCAGERSYRQLSSAPGAAITPVCGFPQTLHLHQQPAVIDIGMTHRAARWAAFSDVHGQFDLMVRLLQANGIIDADLNWAWGDGHLILTGDVFDRGPRQTEALWLLYRLDEQAKRAGGAFHMLLGNHETMVMYDDTRYLNPKYAVVSEVLGRRMRDLYDEHSVLGRWLRSKNMIVQVNDTLFMHGGLSPEVLQSGHSLPAINQLFQQSLGLPRAVQKTVPALDLIYGRSGPVWYRGYFVEPRLPVESLQQLLDHLSVRQIVVGHTTMNGVHGWYAGRVYSIDANMKSGANAQMLFFENGQFSLGGLDGRRQSVPEAGPDTERNL